MPSTHEQSTAQLRKAHLARSFDLASDTYEEAHGDFVNPVGDRLAYLADLRPGDRVLDLGCGRGAVLFAAVAAVGPDGYVAGVDLSPGMVRRTAAQAARAGLRNVSVRVDDAEDLGFPDRSFEAVLSSFTLPLLPDPAAALAGAHRVLAPGGRLGLTGPGAGAEPEPGWRRALPALLPYLGPDADWPAADGDRAVAADRPGGDPERALAAAGFTGVRTVEEPAVVVHADVHTWWRSLWAGGHRALLETIAPGRRAQAREAACAAVEPLTERGRLVHRTSVRYTLARRD
ncbi:class I SAM-dependent methyltransferase [Streptomyces sp. NPDC092296]|uniref:class I SAM-dependent methyltransferase n=1 Tax=Streptomyces sp. NPDC092296 TaxID=3366012 RepID=UPI00382C9BCC